MTPALTKDELRRLAAWRADGHVLLEGFHAVKHALRFGADVELVAAVEPEATRTLAARLAPDVLALLEPLLRDAKTRELSQVATPVPHTKVLGLARRPVLDALTLLAQQPDRHVIALEDPRNLGNLGAVVRVVAAAGAAGVLTTGLHDPWDPAALRGSAGLHFAVPVARVEDFDGLDRPLVALDPEGAPLMPDAIPEGAILAFGTERDGLSDHLLNSAAARVSLPMRPGVSSLNLATSVAAVLFVLNYALSSAKRSDR